MSVLEVGRVVELRIEDLGAEGQGVARHEGFVVFVEGALPGDLVRAQVLERRRSFARAERVELLEASEQRVDAPCPLVGACGGCPLMELHPERALELKAAHLEQTLRRVGGVDVRLERVVPSPRALRYRNRVRFALGAPGAAPRLGFRPRGAPWGLVEVEDCLLLPEGLGSIAHDFVDRLAAALPQSARRAWPTHLSLRGSHAEDRWLLVLHGPPGALPGARRVAEEFAVEQERVAGVVRVTERGPRILGEELLSGRGEVREKIAGREVSLGATSFLQVNPAAAGLLYEELAGLLARGAAPRTLLELYGGVGLASLVATPPGTRVLGVESHPAAVEAARRAARDVGRGDEIRHECADAGALLARLVREGARFDALLANPPRAGADPALAPSAAALRARIVVLMSCHPATLARDARRLVEQGYRVESALAVDLFPQTPHLEALMRFSRP